MKLYILKSDNPHFIRSRNYLSVAEDDIAPELWKLENHLRQPPIVRNCRKRQQEVKIQKQELEKGKRVSSHLKLHWNLLAVIIFLWFSTNLCVLIRYANNGHQITMR